MHGYTDEDSIATIIEETTCPNLVNPATPSK
jgi:hypothetical protein